MINQSENRNFTIFWLITFVTSYVYYVLKAHFVPMFGDEAATFYFYEATAEFLPFLSHADANNHFLNSFLSTISYNLFGSSKLSLRLASLLTYSIYFYYSFKLSRSLKSNFLQWVLMISLILSHNFTEFFSLNRGYAMSMAFLLGMLYHLSSFLKSLSFKDFMWYLLMNFLMLSSILSLMVPALIAGGIAILKVGLSDSINKKIKFWISFLFLWVAPLIFFIKVSFYFKEMGLLYYGNLDGFWETTVKSVIAMIFSSYNIWIGIFFVISLLIILLSYFKNLFKYNFFNFIVDKNILYSHLIIGSISAIFLMSYLLEVHFPEDRVGMYLYPLIIIAFIKTLDRNDILPANKFIIYLATPLLLLPIHYISEINLKYTRCYIEDYLPEEYYEQIKEDNNPDYSPLIGAYRTRGMSWYYQNYRHNGEMPHIFWTHYPDTISDYIIGNINENDKYRLLYDSLAFDKVNSRYLLKRKKFLNRVLIFDSKETAYTGTTEDEFIEIWKLRGDSLNGRTLLFEYDIELSADEKPFESWLVASSRDSSGNSLLYEYTGLDWAVKEFNNTNIKMVMVLYNISNATDKKVTYLWNINKKPLTLHKNRIKIYELKD